MSKKVDLAIKFAVDCHSGAKRKMTTIPYILHPMEAATVAASLTDDEDVIIASLLHDTMEDAGVKKDELEKLFGKRVADLVASESEDKRPGMPAEDSWLIRKKETLEVLEKAEDDAEAILWIADKLANIRSIYANWLEMGDKVFDRFHVKDKAMHSWYYRKVALLTKEKWSKYPAWMEYDRLCELVFADTEYKEY